MTCRTTRTLTFRSNNSSICLTLSFTLNRSAELGTGHGEQTLVKQEQPMMPDGVYTFKRTAFILTCKTTYLYIVYSLISNCLFFSLLSFVLAIFYRFLSFFVFSCISSFFPSISFLPFLSFSVCTLPTFIGDCG